MCHVGRGCCWKYLVQRLQSGPDGSKGWSQGSNRGYSPGKTEAGEVQACSGDARKTRGPAE